MSQRLYITYKGDQEDLGLVGDGVDANLVARVVNDIVDDMRVNYDEDAAITLSLM